MRLIDADELIEHVYRERLDSRKLIAQMVESAPTIEPHRENGYRDGYKRGKRVGYKKGRERKKTGRWIYEEDGIIHGHCSCCGFRAIYQETDVFGYDFCPNCGARMEEGEQEC